MDRTRAQRDKEEHVGAIAEYKTVIRLDPKGVETFADGAFEEEEEQDEAIRACTNAIRVDPGSEWAWTIRGIAWFKKKEYDKAIADFSAAIERGSKSATCTKLVATRGTGRTSLTRRSTTLTEPSRSIPSTRGRTSAEAKRGRTQPSQPPPSATTPRRSGSIRPKTPPISVAATHISSRANTKRPSTTSTSTLAVLRNPSKPSIAGASPC